MRKIAFSYYRNAFSVDGTVESAAWDQWIGLLTAHSIRPDKDGPAIVLGEIKGPRRNTHVRSIHALSLDLEGLTEDQIIAALEPLKSFEYIAYTTHRHTPDAPRLRVILPLRFEIKPEEHAAAWAGLNALVGGVNDPATKDLARLNYLPSAPPGAEHHAIHNEGLWLSVDNLPKTTHDQKPTPEEPERAQKSLLRKARHRLCCFPKFDDLNEAGKALAAGKSFAPEGERHNVILDLTWFLADSYPEMNEATVEALFAPSLETMAKANPSDHPELSEVLKAFVGAKEKTALERIHRTEQKHAQRAKATQIRQTDNQGPYTEAELDHIAARNGWKREDLTRRWAIQHKGTYFFLGADGDYRQASTPKDVEVMSYQVLKRAPIRLITLSREAGISYRPVSDVMREAGQVATKLIGAVGTERHAFDPETGIMAEALCPPRKLTPTFDPVVDEWLKLFAGRQYEKLLDWLACAPDTDKLLCALYFSGAPSTGKTTFAHGVAHIWTDGGPAPLDLVLGDFNDELSRCPVVFGDEKLPRRFQTDATSELRRMIGTSIHSLHRKYQAPTEMHGALRVILNANNPYLLDASDMSTDDDLQAVSQRFLYINTPREASEYWSALSSGEKNRIRRDGIPRHCLWLAQNREVKPGKRFWVEGEVGDMHRALMFADRYRSAVAEWLVRYLLNPQPIDSRADGLVRRGGGELLVNDQAVIDGWEVYVKNKIDPETRRIGSALNGLTIERTRRRFKGKIIRYRKINTDQLAAWSDIHNIGDADTLGNAINTALGKGDDGPIDDFGTVPPVNDEGSPF